MNNMMNRREIHGLYLFIILILNYSCGMKSNNEIETQNDSIENNYVGEWQSIERDSPFDAILAIDSNKIFKYIGGACVTSFESEGHWILQADTIIL